MTPKKLNLAQIKVTSFLTNLKPQEGQVYGGAFTMRIDSNCSPAITLHPRC